MIEFKRRRTIGIAVFAGLFLILLLGVWLNSRKEPDRNAEIGWKTFTSFDFDDRSWDFRAARLDLWAVEEFTSTDPNERLCVYRDPTNDYEVVICQVQRSDRSQVWKWIDHGKYWSRTPAGSERTGNFVDGQEHGLWSTLFPDGSREETVFDRGVEKSWKRFPK